MDLSELIPGNEPNGNTDLNKQDILQLLNTGLKENQNFAKWFADTVLRDIQRKLKDIKIQSSPIQIDGKAISKDINEGIREGLEKDIDKTVDTIRKEITDTGKDISKSADKNPMSLSSILGQTPAMSTFTRMKFQGLTRTILSKIEKGLPDKIELGAKEGVKLGDIFTTTNKDKIPSLQMWFKWNKLQKTIIDKITQSVPDKFTFKGEVGLNEIFRPPKGADFLSISLGQYKKWNKIQTNILDKIEGASKGEIAFKKEISLGEIFRPPKGAGFLSLSLGRYKTWNKIQSSILENIEKASKEFTFKKEISIGEIFRPPAGANFLSMSLSRYKTWNKIQNNILENVEKASKEFTFKKEISLGEIFRPPAGANFLSLSLGRYKTWNKIQNNILGKISDQVKDIQLSGKDGITLNEIMGAPPKAGFLTRMKWGSLQRTILDKITKGVKESDDKTEKKQPRDAKGRFAPAKAPKTKDADINTKLLQKISDMGKPKDKKEFKSLEAKGQEVEVGGFTDKALKDLSKIFGKEKGKKEDKNKDKTSITDMLSKMKGMSSMLSKAGSMLKNFGAGAAKQIGLKPLSAGGGAFATGLASAGTNLLLAKYAVDLGRMATNKNVRSQKEDDAGKSLSDPKKGFFGKALSGVANLPAVITGYFSEKEKQQKLKGEGAEQSSMSKKKLEQMVKSTIGEGKLDEIKKKAFKDPALMKARDSGDMSKYDSMYQKFIGNEARKLQTKQEKKPEKKETPIIARAEKSKGEKPIKSDQEKIDFAQFRANRWKLGQRGGHEEAWEERKRKKKEFDERGDSQSIKPKADMANDFIWRSGKPIQKFNSKDNLIATKDGGVFDKLIAALKDDKKQVPQNNQQLHQDINKLIQKMNNVMDIVAASTKGSKSETPQKDGLAGIPEDAGTVRDPAYVLRSRAWDRIRKGYVVI